MPKWIFDEDEQERQDWKHLKIQEYVKSSHEVTRNVLQSIKLNNRNFCGHGRKMIQECQTGYKLTNKRRRGRSMMNLKNTTAELLKY